jgi:hypothetical protein
MPLLLGLALSGSLPIHAQHTHSDWQNFDDLPKIKLQNECRFSANGALWTFRIKNDYSWPITLISSGSQVRTERVFVKLRSASEWSGLTASSCDGTGSAIELDLQLLWHGGDRHLFYLNGGWYENRAVDYNLIASVLPGYEPGSWVVPPENDDAHHGGWLDAVSALAQGVIIGSGGAAPPPIPNATIDDEGREDPATNSGNSSNYIVHNECVSHTQRGDEIYLTSICQVPITVVSCRKDPDGDCMCSDTAGVRPGAEIGRWKVSSQNTVLWKAAFTSEINGVPGSLYPACRLKGAR